MNFSAYWKPSLLLLAFSSIGSASWTAEMSADKGAIAKTIKSDVAQVAAGINSHDAVKTTAFDAPDVVSMECGSPSTVGVEADREGFETGFAHDPFWKVSLIDETVDVASSGDLAVYRGTYNEEKGSAGVVLTHKTFIAEFKRQNDRSWSIVWYSVSNMKNRIRSDCWVLPVH